MNKTKMQNVGYGKMLTKKIDKGKSGQFKIQQMAFMLLAVFLFFILVALFWLAIQNRNLQKEATLSAEEEAIMLSQFLSDSAEFNCADESYCIDIDKLIFLKNKTSYQEFWPSDVGYIRVRKVWPVDNANGGKDVECNIVNYPNCNVFSVYGKEGGKGIGSFVALCRYEKVESYVNRKCELGKLIIGYKTK